MSATAFQRRRRELAALEEEQQNQNQGDEAIEQNPVDDVVGDNAEEAARFDVEEMTKAQIIEALEELGVDFNNRDNKEVLKGLLLDANK